MPVTSITAFELPESLSGWTIDYVLLSLRLRLRSPLTAEAFSALVRAADEHNFKVAGLSDGTDSRNQAGPSRLIRLLPPNRSSNKAAD